MTVVVIWATLGCGFCQNVTFADDEFKDNKALNDQGKDEGTQPQHKLELDLIMVRNHHHQGTFRAL